jgi:hypothetical protein
LAALPNNDARRCSFAAECGLRRAFLRAVMRLFASRCFSALNFTAFTEKTDNAIPDQKQASPHEHCMARGRHSTADKKTDRGGIFRIIVR